MSCVRWEAHRCRQNRPSSLLLEGAVSCCCGADAGRQWYPARSCPALGLRRWPLASYNPTARNFSCRACAMLSSMLVLRFASEAIRRTRVACAEGVAAAPSDVLPRAGETPSGRSELRTADSEPSRCCRSLCRSICTCRMRCSHLQFVWLWCRVECWHQVRQGRILLWALLHQQEAKSFGTQLIVGQKGPPSEAGEPTESALQRPRPSITLTSRRLSHGATCPGVKLDFDTKIWYKTGCGFGAKIFYSA